MSAGKPARNRKKKAGTPAPDEAVAEKAVSIKGLFTKDLAHMMYGFGDDRTPYKESVELVEEMMVDYVVETMQKAVAMASAKGARLTAEDVMFQIRKDTNKCARAKELLVLQKQFAVDKKTIDVDDLSQY